MSPASEVILNAVPDSLIISDEQGFIRWCNTQVNALLNYSPQELVGRSVDVLVPKNLNRDHAKARQKYSQDPSVRPMGSAASLFALGKGGEKVAVDIELSPLVWEGEDCVLTVLRCRETKLALEQQQQKQLRENEERLRRSQNIAHIGTWDWNIPEGKVIWSDEVYSIVGQRKTTEYVGPDSLADFLPPGEKDRLSDLVAAALHEGQDYVAEHRIIRPNGEVRFVKQVGEVYRDSSGQVVRMLGTVQDITREREHRKKLQLSQTVFEYANEGILSTDADFRIVSVNPVLERLSGYTRKQLIGRHVSCLVPRDQRVHYLGKVKDRLVNDGCWRGDGELLSRNAPIIPVLLSVASVPDIDGGAGNYVVTITDISQLKFNESQLDFLAHYDQLTRLPNRTLFLQELTNRISASKDVGLKLALLYIDLDGFKKVNDSQGHSAGDELLFEVAEQLRENVDVSAFVSRLGGDEFAVLLQVDDDTQSEAVAEKLIQKLQLRKDFSDHSLDISASIGIANFPDDGDDPLELIKKSDQAMYEAKANGKNSFQHYNAQVGDLLKYRIKLMSDLGKAIQSGDLSLHVQPKLTVADEAQKSVEALVRWHHPDRGQVTPVEFIPIAEESGQIIEVGRQVINMACAFLKRWNEAQKSPLEVAVNLSARQLNDTNLLSDIAAVIDNYGVDPSCLQFEITETVVMQDVESSLRVFEGIQAMGASIAIDDFGTGYSSLSYLKKLPVDVLKIDRSFIAPLPSSGDDLAIVKAIISMARSLNIEVVAEGVETEAQKTLLIELGCHHLQGYHLGRPMDIEHYLSQPSA